MERVVVCASSFSSLLPECRSNILLPASSSSPRRRTSVVVKSLNSVDSSSSSSSSDQAVEASTTTSNDGRSSRDLLLASAVDVPPFSLISYANIKKAFTAEPLLTPDHYTTLGLTPAASYGEVEIAYKQRCESVLQQSLKEDEIRTKLRILKVSYDILSSEEERRLYDWSLYHVQSPDVYRWPYESDITQSTYGPFPMEEAEDDEGVRKVGYFFFGWFVLSVVLSIALR